MQLKVYAEHAHSRGCKQIQDFVKRKRGNGTDCLHHNGRKPYAVGVCNNAPLRAEAFQANGYKVALAEQENEPEHHGNGLSANGSNRSARNTHGWKAEIPENKDRVKHNVEDCACKLNEHRANGVARSLNGLFRHGGENRKAAKPAAKPEICRCKIQNFRIVRKRSKELLREHRIHEHKHKRAHQREELARRCCRIRIRLPAFAEPARDE